VLLTLPCGRTVTSGTRFSSTTKKRMYWGDIDNVKGRLIGNVVGSSSKWRSQDPGSGGVLLGAEPRPNKPGQLCGL
jgi:hypothetical protein